MFATLRHQHILSTLRNEGSVSAARLRAELRTNAMTVWRDLKALEELGLLRRVRGGARSGHSPAEPDYESKNAKAGDAKRRIARLAVREFVREGDSLALEGGTTVAALIDCLPPSRVSILTNSLPVAMHSRAVRPECPILFAGGWISRVSGNASGPETLRAMETWVASVCFLGATAFDGAVGPSDPSPLEIEAKRKLASRAHHVVMLVDSSKFGQRSTAVTLHPKRINILVSDAEPPLAVLALLKKHGVRLMIA